MNITLATAMLPVLVQPVVALDARDDVGTGEGLGDVDVGVAVIVGEATVEAGVVATVVAGTATGAGDVAWHPPLRTNAVSTIKLRGKFKAFTFLLVYGW